MAYSDTAGYKIRNQAATHFLTFTVVGWIDIFSRKRYRGRASSIAGRIKDYD